VEDAVDDDPVQFTFVVVIGELFRIGAYGIEADEEVTAKAVAFTVVESDDICVIIVLQILAVHFEYLLVRAEDVTDIACLLPVGLGYRLDPSADRFFLDCRELEGISTPSV
jgi:hypothetical protein